MTSVGKWQAVAITHPGLLRDHNEDAFLCDPDNGFLVVADGMGGHAGGALASKKTVAAIAEFAASVWDSASEEAIPDFLKGAMAAANDAVLAAHDDPDGGDEMGSTVVAAFLSGNRLFGASVGDSRAYLVGEGIFHRLTQDHSMAQESGDVGNRANGGNCLYAWIGDTNLGQPCLFQSTFEARQRLLLCTDGLTDMLSDPAIASTICTTPDLSQACQFLIDEALRAGGEDNVTVLLAEFVPQTEPVLEPEKVSLFGSVKDAFRRLTGKSNGAD